MSLLPSLGHCGHGPTRAVSASFSSVKSVADRQRRVGFVSGLFGESAVGNLARGLLHPLRGEREERENRSLWVALISLGRLKEKEDREMLKRLGCFCGFGNRYCNVECAPFKFHLRDDQHLSIFNFDEHGAKLPRLICLAMSIRHPRLPKWQTIVNDFSLLLTLTALGTWLFCFVSSSGVLYSLFGSASHGYSYG